MAACIVDAKNRARASAPVGHAGVAGAGGKTNARPGNENAPPTHNNLGSKGKHTDGMLWLCFQCLSLQYSL